MNRKKPLLDCSCDKEPGSQRDMPVSLTSDKKSYRSLFAWPGFPFHYEHGQSLKIAGLIRRNTYRDHRKRRSFLVLALYVCCLHMLDIFLGFWRGNDGQLYVVSRDTDRDEIASIVCNNLTLFVGFVHRLYDCVHKFSHDYVPGIDGFFPYVVRDAVSEIGVSSHEPVQDVIAVPVFWLRGVAAFLFLLWPIPVRALALRAYCNLLLMRNPAVVATQAMEMFKADFHLLKSIT